MYVIISGQETSMVYEKNKRCIDEVITSRLDERSKFD